MNQKKIRAISFCLALITLQSAIFPSVSLALTSGPSMPEYSSFEPVDTPDMVNLFTGDLSYNIPLLNVPSPEGGYPLSLSYHSGIELNQEASWVGLGWTLNPGAITRSSVVYPDDYDGNGISSYFNNGGGGGYSIGGGYGPYGATLTNDSEKGWGGSVTLGWGPASVGFNTDGTASIGINAYGFNAGINSEGKVSAGYGPFGIGYSKDDGLSASIGTGALSIGMSLSSKGLNGGVSLYGQSIGVSAKSAVSASDWIFSSSGFYYPILNTGAWISHSSYTYFLQSTKNENSYGMLYYQNAPNSVPCCYSGSSSLEFYQKTNNAPNYQNTNMITYSPDMYSVGGQGISGNIRPYRTSNGSVSAINNAVYPAIGAQYKAYKKFSSGKPAFRYIGEPSNDFQYHYDPNKFNIDYVFSPNYGGHTEAVAESLVQNNPPNDQKQNNGRLASGKFIEWFSNEELINDPTLIVDPLSSADRSKFPASGIGAIKITNTEGTVYTYAIPVYNTYQQNYSEDPNRAVNNKFGYTELKTPYAYSWMLTSVNGSDFIDRGTTGDFDSEDWGYWVRFDYGKWTDYYHWRSPYESFAENMKDANKSLSYGNKQIYYLNKIVTRTHTALFVKEPRSDGKGTSAHYEFVTSGNALHGIYEGGGKKLGPRVTTSSGGTEISVAMTRHVAASLMKLNKIMLFKNEDISASDLTESVGTPIDDYYPDFHYANGNHSTVVGNLSSTNVIFESDKLHLYDNVMDINDVSSSNLDVSKALKIVEFNTDYSLCKGIPNNFDTDVDMNTILDNYPNGSWNISDPSINAGGKLTLKEVQIKGLGGTVVMPSTKFEYDNNPDYDKNKWDGWGMYKSNGSSYKYSHQSTPTKEGDAWSMTKIITPLGGEIDINYERDQYSTNEGSSLLFVDYLKFNSVTQPTRLDLINSLYNLVDFYNSGAKIEITARVREMDWDGDSGSYDNYFDDVTAQLNVNDIFSNYMTFNQNLISLWGLYPPISGTIASGGPNGNARFIDGPVTIKAEVKFKYGGDIRVSKVTLKDEFNNQYSTEYIYTEDGLKSGKSSGASSQEPEFISGIRDRELNSVAPMVGYSKITTYKMDANGSTKTGKTVYEFNNVDVNSVKINRKYYKDEVINPVSNTVFNSHSGWTVYSAGWLEEDFSSFIGAPKSVSALDNLGALLSKKEYKYYETPPTGVITEGVNMDVTEPFKLSGDNMPTYFHRLIRTTKISYPCILKSIVTNQKGITNTLTNTDFDFYTGKVTETEFVDSNGKKYRTKLIPAYTKSAYADMGSKFDDVNNKNMLVQETANYTYSVDGSNTEHLISASVQTWNNFWNYRDYVSSAYVDDDETDIWRKHKEYVWKSALDNNGTISSFTDFDWSGSPDIGWQKINEVTRYDRFSQPLEAMDINGNYSAIKTGYDGNYVIASSGTSNYRSFTHTSFEDIKDGDYYEGEVDGVTSFRTLGSSLLAINYKAHTGKYVAKIGAGQYGPGYHVADAGALQTGKTYRAAVWVHDNSPNTTSLVAQLDGTSGGAGYYDIKSMSKNDPKAITAGDWKLLYVNIEVPSDYVPSGGSLNDLRIYVSNTAGSNYAYIDDMRLQPLNSPVNGYVYDAKTGLLSAILDNENFATLFTYDDAGRLTRTEKESTKGIKKVSETFYQFGRP